MKYRNLIPLIAMLVGACEQPDGPAPESEAVAPIEQPARAVQAPTASEAPVVAPPSAADSVLGTTPTMSQDDVDPDHPVGATMEAVPEQAAPEGLMQDYAPPMEDATIIHDGDGTAMEELDVGEEYVEEPDHSMGAPMDETDMTVEDVPNLDDMSLPLDGDITDTPPE